MTDDSPTSPALVEELTHPIIGIGLRTAQEVFDIMCDRFRHATRSPVPGETGAGEGSCWKSVEDAIFEVLDCHVSGIESTARDIAKLCAARVIERLATPSSTG